MIIGIDDHYYQLFFSANWIYLRVILHYVQYVNWRYCSLLYFELSFIKFSFIPLFLIYLNLCTSCTCHYFVSFLPTLFSVAFILFIKMSQGKAFWNFLLTGINERNNRNVNEWEMNENYININNSTKNSKILK